nr:hypothetical protein [uncultured Anaerostipes sp.]
MGKAKNKVIAGDFKGAAIGKLLGSVFITPFGHEAIELNNNTVEYVETITERHQKSAVSGVARGAVGAALLGPVGMLAGLSAKSKGVHIVAIKFVDGTNSLVEVDDKLYESILKKTF